MIGNVTDPQTGAMCGRKGGKELKTSIRRAEQLRQEQVEQGVWYMLMYRSAVNGI